SIPSVVQKRACAKGRSLEIANTIVLSISAASLLNVRTDVAHTLVSRLGKIFRTTRLPFSLAKVNSDKSVFTNEKSGATEPTEGRLPFVFILLPANVIFAIV